MSAVFADTWFFLAILNHNDPGHARAAQLHRSDHRHRITTTWVLTEVGDALCQMGNRDMFVQFHDWITRHPNATVIPASQDLFDQGVYLFRCRRDKNWPLTDCISFTVMDDEQIQDAFTADKHFEQAGFKALLK